jgi:hypothetical protein
VITAFGPIPLIREYSWHREDGGVFRADLALGLDGVLTRQARRLATWAGVEQSFARAQQMLQEFCGWTLDDELIRRTTHAEAKRVQGLRSTRGDAAAFAKADAPIEVLIDAGKVNTLDGWRDVKLGLFLRRILGLPAAPEQWDDRELPPPRPRTVIAAIEEAESFGHRLRREADRLQVTSAADVTVLGDGAEWIWNLADEHLPQAAGVLDIYHALERVSTAVKLIWGDGTDMTNTQTEAARHAVIAHGKAGFERWLGSVLATVPDTTATAPLLAAAAYLAKHPTRLDYATRLAAGRSIGSGAVEGAIKQIINLRMKRTGARWKVDHVGPFVELRTLSETPEWHHMWTAA